MAKKKNIKELEKIEKVGTFDGDILNKVYVILGIVVFLCFFYVLTLYITSKNSDEAADAAKDEQTEAAINYEETVIGRSLSMSDGEYLVICYDKSDEDITSTYESLVSEYQAKADHLDIYTVNMGNSFNKSYATDGESKKNPENVSEMAINGPTLMKVSSGKVVDYIEGEDAISNYLK